MKCMICNSIMANKCLGCGYKSIESSMPDNFYEKKYFSSVITFESKPKHMRYVLRKCEAKGKILDIGCGMGLLLDEAKKIGCEGIGIEISNYALEQRKDLDIRRDFTFPDNYFDMVFMIGVIEHLQEPQSMINKIVKVLKKEGKLVITTVNSKLPHLTKPPEHLSYFNKRNIKMFLENNDFDVLSINHYRINEMLIIARMNLPAASHREFSS